MPRMLFLTRGVAGCGKSTFIRENGLEPLTVSADKMRLLYRSPEMDCDGKFCVPQSASKKAWELVHSVLAERFASGATTILDATNLRAKDVRPIRNLAREHRYRVYYIDFTDVPEDEIYRRNAGRDEMSRVPEHVIARMLNVAVNEEPVPGIQVLSRDEALDVLSKPYKTGLAEGCRAVNVIGDVQGAGTALALLMGKIGNPDDTVDITALAGTPGSFEETTVTFPMPREDEKYVFVGDLIDRGLENVHVLEYMKRILSDDRFDVTLLEGNHEKWIRIWGEDSRDDSDAYVDNSFSRLTRKQLKAAGYKKKDARYIASRAGQYLYFELGDGDRERFFVCHGGLAAMPERFADVSAYELIHGSGAYSEVSDVDASWDDKASGPSGHGIVSVHGHRNDALDMFAFDHVLELEGGVEYGRELRCVRIGCERGGDGSFPMEDMSVDNPVFDIPDSELSLEDLDDVGAVIQALRSNYFIKEKYLANGISSFNFSRKAFAKKMWDSQNVKARGLFVDVEGERVKARSYDKFFNVGERDDTRLDALAKSFEFPVTAYVKENGYLGICSWEEGGKLFCASKSTDEGPFARRFSQILHDALGEKVCEFSEFLRERDMSAVFEVIDPEHDRHMVKYVGPRAVLLCCVENRMRFSEVGYDELCAIAERFGLDVKAKGAVLETPEELMDWYSRVKSYSYMFDGHEGDAFGNLDGLPESGYHVEGFVLTDAAGNMAKVKGDWYSYWKFFRGVAKEVAKRGKSSKVSRADYVSDMAGAPDVQDVYAFIRGEVSGSGRDGKRVRPDDVDIIELREAFCRIGATGKSA